MSKCALSMVRDMNSSRRTDASSAGMEIVDDDDERPFGGCAAQESAD